MSVGVVILAGGASRRMGADKAGLPLLGESFLGRLLGELADYDERLVSVADAASAPQVPDGVALVPDGLPGCGPLGGLYSALEACRSDALLAVACDMPLFPAGLGRYLELFLDAAYDCVLPQERGGRLQPLCGIYRKSVVPALRRQLAAGHLRMHELLGHLRVRVVPLEHSAYPDEVLRNVNTPAEYQDIRRLVSGPPLLRVCGAKNSGKTTLLEGVVRALTARGLRVGVLKHDGHDFTPDVPGTDSYRLRAAGADPVAVYSAQRYALAGSWREASPEALLPAFRAADLVLLEGGKASPGTKLEVIRAAVSAESVANSEGLLAVCTDADGGAYGVPRLPLDPATVADAIRGWLLEGKI